MTPADLKAWRARLALSQVAAADALGISVSAFSNYELGYRREDPSRPTPIPKVVALACAYLELRETMAAAREAAAMFLASLDKGSDQ